VGSQVSKWVATEIVKCAKIKHRVLLTKKFIEVAQVPLPSQSPRGNSVTERERVLSYVSCCVCVRVRVVRAALPQIEQLQHAHGHRHGRSRQRVRLSTQILVEGTKAVGAGRAMSQEGLENQPKTIFFIINIVIY
jgi:hypothetical protein